MANHHTDLEKRLWDAADQLRANSKLRPMKQRWASCSNKGNLTFDLDILQQPAEFRRKIIVHELIHLKYHNHGKMFKALERTYLKNDEK